MTEPVSGMGARRALLCIGAVFLLVTAGGLPAVPQDNPMITQPVDDEPESAVTAPSGPSAPVDNPPVAAPAGSDQRVAAYPPHPAPLPPVRPFSIESVPGGSGGRPAAAPVISSAPIPAIPTPPSVAPVASPSLAAPGQTVAEPASPTAPDGETRVASLPTTTQPATTREIEDEEEKTPEPMLVEKQTDAVDIACLRPELLRIIRIAGEHFKGTPVITSGQRNRGRLGSYHRKCMAADFFVPGIERARLAKFLRTLPEAGGVGTYCHTKSVHIDVGEPRNWWQCGFRFRFAQR